jgi:IS5 family transposase
VAHTAGAQVEQALCVRLDLMAFTGFEFSAGQLPDVSTICRFGNRLVISAMRSKVEPAAR